MLWGISKPCSQISKITGKSGRNKIKVKQYDLKGNYIRTFDSVTEAAEATKIQRLNTAKAGIKSALEAKGVTVDSATTLDGYPQLVASIPSGGDDTTLKELITGSNTGFTLPVGVTTIKQYLEYGNGNLETVNLNNFTNVRIYSAAFRGCTNLTGVTNASGISFIDTYAFYDCKKLKTIEGLPALNAVGQEMFSDCRALETPIVINTYNAGGSAFKNCWKIPSFTFMVGFHDTNGNYSSMGIFAGCTGCTYWDFTNTFCIPTFDNQYDFSGCAGEIRIPAIMQNALLKSKSPLGMDNRLAQTPVSGNIVTVADKYPSSIINYTTTGDTIMYPPTNGISTYNNAGFGIVDNEYDATTGGTMVLYGPSAYTPHLRYITSGKQELKSISCTATTVGTGTEVYIQNLKGLTDVYLPNITSIPSGSFGGCSNLTSATFTNLETMGKSCFRDCTALTSFDFTNIIGIGNEVFANSGLESLSINCDVSESAFVNCNSLTSVTFGNGVTKINSNAFSAVTQTISEMTFLRETPPSLIGGSIFYWRNNTFSGVIYCPASAVEAYTTWKKSSGTLSGWTVQAIS